ncbi:hydrogenase [candidate division WOR_3 bacterium SM23_60]|uniref:Hydrogenase n=1 Tax=candidate division WOR_3 bacterium SM23_60 TaxID=1703780 RepID=A0A0S8GHW9_UNCW3|nr:MAG: hydrogenase [candidate division WOR_3 bacterium SM23_60]
MSKEVILKQYRTHLLVCAGTGCVAAGSYEIKKALEKEIAQHQLQKEVRIISTGCNGFCERGPIVVVQPDGIFYQRLKKEDVPHLVEEHLIKGRPVKKLMYVPPAEERPIPKMSDIGFFKHQRLIVLRNRGRIDPEDITEYIAFDGYRALEHALTKMTPEGIIKEIKHSGLRGRGGAGFPTGLKWEKCRAVPGDVKYVVCNADEGDPGAFMDRSVLEADPHAVIEGMIIGARGIGADKGYIYVRTEYPLAIKRLDIALKQARSYGLLGKDILGSGFGFDIELVRGAGAFVSGEETSLLAAIEGKVGVPKQRPPYPVEKGLFAKPTNINNVETWANVPQIILRGSPWYSEIGTEGSKGTKIFSLVGKINNTGLVEVPMGITLKDIVYEIGGGIPENRKFKAVQTGGPSGGCIPRKLLDIPIDYESLKQVGSMMGSGGMIVMDEDTCMVDVAKYFMNFLRDESCGKCLSCREGTQRMYEILDKITKGEGTMEDLDLLHELALATRDASMCGLGQTAGNPVLSTLQYFYDEYVEHIKHRRCPAVVCKQIISSPCQHTCPIDTEAPQYIAYIARGEFNKAYDIILKDNPLLGICSRVCHHPCETKCRAGQGGDPISIRALKRFAIEHGNGHKKSVKRSPRGKKIAIIGSGPSGLTAAYALTHKSYAPTIFEAQPVVGGMCALGIPEYRLPRAVLNEDITRVLNAGTQIKTNQRLGRDFTIDDLLKQGYEAIYLATGAHVSIKLGIPNEDVGGILPAMRFLTNVHLGKTVEVGKRVAVVGGGNSAVDAARVAYRLPGVERVTILYRRTRAEMPAYKEEIEAALEEGIDIHFLTTPTAAIEKNKKIISLECQRMELGAVDSSGRRRPIPIKNSEFNIEIDTLIPAISEQPDLTWLDKDANFKISGWNTLEVDDETLATNVPGVFAGGDVIRGPSTVIQAMADGKKVAQSIDKYVKGEKMAFTYAVTRPSVYVEPVTLGVEEVLETARQVPKHLAVEKRGKNFREVDLGLDKKAAVREARRCLRCDLEVKKIDDAKES